MAAFDAVADHEPQSETVCHEANRYKVPRVCFVNKLDRIGANFHRCVDMIKDRLGARAMVMQIPVGLEADLQGVVDLVEMKAIIWKTENLGADFDMSSISNGINSFFRNVGNCLPKVSNSLSVQKISSFLKGPKEKEDDVEIRTMK